MEFGFMLFAKDQKLLDNINFFFWYVVADMKALIPTPTQKKMQEEDLSKDWETSWSHVAIHQGEHP